MRREIYVSSESDLLLSGVEVRQSRTWYSSSPHVLREGHYHWIFVEIAICPDVVQDELMQFNEARLSFEEIMLPSFALAVHKIMSLPQKVPIFSLRKALPLRGASAIAKANFEIERLERRLKQIKKRLQRGPSEDKGDSGAICERFKRLRIGSKAIQKKR